MKRPLLILALLFSSIFSLSAQTRLGTVPRSINRADNPYYALDSILLGEEYSYTHMGVAMITKNALGGSAACLRSNYDFARKRYELVYLVCNQGRRGREKVKTYRCTIPSETFLELSELFSSAVYASIPGGVVFGADGVFYEFLDGESLSAECWWPSLESDSNCGRLVSLMEKLQNAVRDNDSESIEELRPEIKSLTEVFDKLEGANYGCVSCGQLYHISE